MTEKASVIYVQPNQEEREMFDALCKFYRRGMKDMVLWLVEREYKEVLGSRDENSMVSEKRGI